MPRENSKLLSVCQRNHQPLLVLLLVVVVVVAWLPGSPVVVVVLVLLAVVSVMEAVPSAHVLGRWVASGKISLLGLALRPSTALLMEVGLRHMLVMDVGLWRSPVSVLSVVAMVVPMPATVPVLAS